MHSVLEKIDQLASQIPEDYSRKEQDAYLKACEAVKEMLIKSMNPVSIRRSQAKQIKIRVDIDGRLAHRRRPDHRHPVRLVIYFNGKVKRYAISNFRSYLSTDIDKLYFYQDEWKDLWLSKSSRVKKDLERLEVQVAQIVKEKIQPFSFDHFERLELGRTIGYQE